MTDFDQLLETASRTSERARRLRALANDQNAMPTTRLNAERGLLRLQLTFARSFMDVLVEDACRLSDDLSNGLSFEAPQSGATIWPGG